MAQVFGEENLEWEESDVEGLEEEIEAACSRVEEGEEGHDNVFQCQCGLPSIESFLQCENCGNVHHATCVGDATLTLSGGRSWMCAN